MSRVDALRAPPSPAEATLFDPGAASEPEALLGPPRPVLGAIPEGRLADYNVGVLLALALADAYRDLSRTARAEARMLLEGQLALVLAMTKLEPQVSALLERTARLKQLIDDCEATVHGAIQVRAQVKARHDPQNQYDGTLLGGLTHGPTFARWARGKLEELRRRLSSDGEEGGPGSQDARPKLHEQRDWTTRLPARDRLAKSVEAAFDGADALWGIGWDYDSQDQGALGEITQLREALFDAWYQDYLDEHQRLISRLGELVDVVSAAEAVSRGAEGV